MKTYIIKAISPNHVTILKVIDRQNKQYVSIKRQKSIFLLTQLIYFIAKRNKLSTFAKQTEIQINIITN